MDSAKLLQPMNRVDRGWNRLGIAYKRVRALVVRNAKFVIVRRGTSLGPSAPAEEVVPRSTWHEVDVSGLVVVSGVAEVSMSTS